MVFGEVFGFARSINLLSAVCTALGCGILAGATGLLLSTLVGLDIVGLTFLVIAALSAALVGQLRSLWVTMLAGIGIGVAQACVAAFPAISLRF